MWMRSTARREMRSAPRRAQAVHDGSAALEHVRPFRSPCRPYRARAETSAARGSRRPRVRNPAGRPGSGPRPDGRRADVARTRRRAARVAIREPIPRDHRYGSLPRDGRERLPRPEAFRVRSGGAVAPRRTARPRTAIPQGAMQETSGSRRRAVGDAGPRLAEQRDSRSFRCTQCAATRRRPARTAAQVLGFGSRTGPRSRRPRPASPPGACAGARPPRAPGRPCGA